MSGPRAVYEGTESNAKTGVRSAKKSQLRPGSKNRTRSHHGAARARQSSSGGRNGSAAQEIVRLPVPEGRTTRRSPFFVFQLRSALPAHTSTPPGAAPQYSRARTACKNYAGVDALTCYGSPGICAKLSGVVETARFPEEWKAFSCKLNLEPERSNQTADVIDGNRGGSGNLEMAGAKGFEPPASWSRTRALYQAEAHAPELATSVARAATKQGISSS